MRNFLKTVVFTCAIVGTGWGLMGCQGTPSQDESLNERLAALDQAVADLKTQIAQNQKEIIKQFRGVKGGQQTMIRRGVVINPKSAPKIVTRGDKTDIRIGRAPSLGDPSAPVEVVEFAEFQCPYCMKHAGILQELTEEYPGKVRTGFRHYPLTRHKQAVNAGRAAWAAQRQGKFWEMHDALFSSRGKLDMDVIRGHAEAIGLDMDEFNSDFESSDALDAVFADRKAGRSAGVKGTPTFYVNGILVGNDPNQVRRVIEKELASAGAGKPPA